MSKAEIIAYAVVLFICVPAALKNWTAVGLFVSFAIGQVWWHTLHIPQPTYLSIMCDYFVLVIIFLKAGPFECMELDDRPKVGIRRTWRRVQDCLGELSRSDKLIVSLFPPAWAASVINITDTQRFWFLWFVGILQIFVASVESFIVWRRGQARKISETRPADWFSRQRYAVDEQ